MLSFFQLKPTSKHRLLSACENLDSGGHSSGILGYDPKSQSLFFDPTQVSGSGPLVRKRISGELLKAQILGHLQSFWLNRSRSTEGPRCLRSLQASDTGDLQTDHTWNTNKSDIHFSWCPFFPQSPNLQPRKKHWKCNQFVAFLTPRSVLQALWWYLSMNE